MKILSVNLRAKPETLEYEGKKMRTGINKVPVKGPVLLTPLGVEGDSVVDTRYHGGQYKAVYSYAAEDYEQWRVLWDDPELPWGAFGENLTTEGLDELQVCIGDQFQVGEALLQVGEPRLPCRTLGTRFQDMGIIKQFMDFGTLGIYFQVVEAGVVKAGDEIRLVHRDPAQVPFSEMARLYARDKQDIAGLERVLSADSLPPDWRAKFEGQLARARAKSGKNPDQLDLFLPD